MRHILLFIFLIIFSGMTTAELPGRNIKKNDLNNTSRLINSSVINNLDTVVFDLSTAVITLNSVAVPVYILSDDTVYALDFSMKYDHSRLSFDSVENITGYIQATSYYNLSDSTIRFTSNSMQQYVNDTTLVLIRFTMLTGSISNNDLNTIDAYLNGDPCSIKLINALPNYIDLLNGNDIINIYPNPVSNILYLNTCRNSVIRIFDVNAKQVYQSVISGDEETEIDVAGFSEGIYFINFSNDSFSSSKRIIIIK